MEQSSRQHARRLMDSERVFIIQIIYREMQIQFGSSAKRLAGRRESPTKLVQGAQSIAFLHQG